MNTRKSTINMVSTAMLCGVTVLLGFTPLGMLPLPAPLPSPTTVHIPVIIASLFLGLPSGLIVSLSFGIVSIIRAVQAPIGFNIFFMNPFIAIIPRLSISIIAFLIYRLMSKVSKHDYFSLTISAIAGSLANTIFTLGTILLFYAEDLNVMINNAVNTGGAGQEFLNNATNYVLGLIALPYGLAEATLSALLIPPIVITLKKAIKTTGV